MWLIDPLPDRRSIHGLLQARATPAAVVGNKAPSLIPARLRADANPCYLGPDGDPDLQLQWMLFFIRAYKF